MVPLGQSGEKFWNNWIRPRRVAAEERQFRERAEEIIEFCDLWRVRGDQAKTLSGGQLKLLELARVMIADPKIILLDEPAAGVNPSLMVTLVEKIRARFSILKIIFVGLFMIIFYNFFLSIC